MYWPNTFLLKKQCPIFNLGNHPAVADSALVGMLYNSLGYQNISSFLGSLQEGKSLVIIDGADEGMVKVGNYEAFNRFIKGVADIASKSSKTTFIILGRISAMEIVQLVLEDYNIKTQCVRIEAFTEDQAKEFINKRTGQSDTNVTYVELRDYILASIGDIFKNQHDIKISDYQKFIGYAPVLMSISKLISVEDNPHRLYQDLSRQKVKNINLLITILKSILERDKKEKINTLVIQELVSDRSISFQEMVYENVYTNTEQCYRVLALAMGQNVTMNITGDSDFDNRYEEQIKTWIVDHPFYDTEKHCIQNSVFESYIISVLIDEPSYRKLVYEYLRTKYKDAFMLFYIYDFLRKKEEYIDCLFLPYLIYSAHSLDDSEHKVEVQIEEDDFEKDEALCKICIKGFDREYQYTLALPSNERLYIGDQISNTSVLIPSLDFELNRICSVLSAPINIQCKTLYTKAGDFQVEYAPGNAQGCVVVDCESVVSDFSNGRQYKFYCSKNDDNFKLISSVSPGYPFEQFWEKNIQKSGLSDSQIKIFQKLRRTMSLFKSHSKGRLAKYKAKIDNRRWLGSEEWHFLLDALLSNGVLYEEGNFYFISSDCLSECLGVSYDQLRDGVMTQKIINFIKEIKPNI